MIVPTRRYRDREKRLEALSVKPSPFAWLISTEPPMPKSIPAKHMRAKYGLMTAIAAAPSGPQACPTAIVSTKLYTDVAKAPPIEGTRYFV